MRLGCELVAALWAFFALACASSPPDSGRAALASARQPPPELIVLLTVNGLRADSVGALVPGGNRLTPNLDRLFQDSDLSGAGISASSRTSSALASILTGLQPWTHGAIATRYARLRPEVETLAERLRRLGYRTLALRSRTQLDASLGYEQGFDEAYVLESPEMLAQHLDEPEQGRAFLWLDLRLPSAPYRRANELMDRLDSVPADLPRRVTARGLERLFDPSSPWTDLQVSRYRALYRLNVAHMDDWIGELLASLESDRRWADTLLVFASLRGEELGDYGQSGGGGSLGRALIEVPFAVRLPLAGPSLEPGGDRQVAITRLTATILERAGAAPVPAQAPSLFRESPDGVLSELYQLNGYSELALVEAGYQLIRRAFFGKPEPGYYEVRAATKKAARQLEERLRSGFATSSPLEPGGLVKRMVFEWREGPGLAAATSTEVQDPEVGVRLEQRLRARWLALNGEDLPLRPRSLRGSPTAR